VSIMRLLFEIYKVVLNVQGADAVKTPYLLLSMVRLSVL
jgi:hypothetical protein